MAVFRLLPIKILRSEVTVAETCHRTGECFAPSPAFSRGDLSITASYVNFVQEYVRLNIVFSVSSLVSNGMYGTAYARVVS